MSIILDALNKLEVPKTEFESGNKAPEIKKPDKKGKKFLLYFFVILLGIVAAKTIFIFLPKYLQSAKSAVQQQKPKVVPVTPAVPVVKQANASAKATNAIGSIKATLTEAVKQIPPVSLPKPVTGNVQHPVLNGIAFSPDDSYALVNNKIVKKGDKVDGFTVLEIRENEVELQSEDSKVIKISPTIK